MNDKDQNIKKPVSQFEFAIMEIADPERAEQYRPLTDGEVYKQRENNIRAQMSRLKIKS